MKVCMIGTGYVGRVSGTCFAEIEHEVICVDNDKKKIKGFMRQPVFFDGRNVFEPGKMAALGFIYKGIGR